jgi:hypothetical protein
MNTIRSPAPGVNFFNFGNTRKNTGIVGALNTAANTAMNTMKNTAANVGLIAPVNKGPSSVHILLIIAVFVIVILFGVFWRQVSTGARVAYDTVRSFFGAYEQAPPSEEITGPPVTEKPEAPQNDSVKESSLVEKVLPGRQQVFNVSKNSYTYYDAEPLCKALGAELATYEQVKQAYAQGADWCNYGWTKGQMAVYPTQEGTWEKLQSGPEDQRNSCGRPGLNGGFFDNPELRFGVNCYGVKPEQKDHDATAVTSGVGAPLSPGALEVDKKIAKYRGEANSIAILPWSSEAWSN